MDVADSRNIGSLSLGFPSRIRRYSYFRERFDIVAVSQGSDMVAFVQPWNQKRHIWPGTDCW